MGTGKVVKGFSFKYIEIELTSLPLLISHAMQLYDFNTNTYFYRNWKTGEFSRVNPVLAQVEAKSSRVPPKNTDPLWRTETDLESGNVFWTDIETGKVCFIRPEVGTFVSELPLLDFRKVKRPTLIPSRKSIRSLATGKSSQSDDIDPIDFNHDDIIFEDLSGGNGANQYDAAAMFGVGSKD